MARITEPDILKFYSKHFGGNAKQVRFLSGDVNKTYLLKSESGEKVILQKLARMFNKDIIEDFMIISQHLTDEGWEVPRIICDKNGKPYAVDDKQFIWRALTFIESDGRPTNVDPTAIGKILAKLHKSFAKLDYQPKYEIPHFHDTEYFYKKLKNLYSEFESEDLLKVDEVIDEYQNLPKLPEVKKQLIHADARMANILFRDNKPFTFIDFDTVMTSTIWVEIGDLVRSIIERDVQDSKKTDIVELHQLSDAYLKHSGIKESSKEFYNNMLTSARLIALELSMRFMIDIIEDFYFVWENTQYGSRHEHSIARVKQQLEVNRRLKNAQE